MSSMADHNNLIDDMNGNPLSTVVTAGQSNASSFLSNIWKRMWPSREARIKYQVHTTTINKDGNSTEMTVNNKICENIEGSSGFWSRIMSTSLAVTPHQREERRDKCDNASSVDSDRVELSLEDRQNGNYSDSSFSDCQAYDQVPRMKTNRKVYGETTSTTTQHIRTRRESILNNNRRVSKSRNLNDYSQRNSDKTLGGNVQLQINGQPMEEGCFRRNQDCNVTLQVKRVSFKDEQEEEDDEQWLDQQRSTSRENFYNVNEVDMASLYRTGKQSDVTIKCRGKDFHVHTFVLKAQSGHFRRLLFIKNESSPIVINDMTWDDMEALLKYMYTGEIDENYAYDGYISSRFSFLLQDYDVPLPHESADMHTAIL